VAVSSPLVTRDFALLTAAHLLQALGYATLILLPLYLGHLNATRTEIGVIMAMGSVGGLAFRPVVGWALDRVGRKPTLIAGTLVLVTAMGLIFFVRDLGPLIYIDRLLVGIGAGTLFTGYFAFAADIIPASRRTEGIALFGISGLLPLAINPFVQDLGIDAPDLVWFFPIIGVLIFLSLPFLLPIPEPPVTKTSKPFKLPEVLSSLRQPQLLPVWFATIVFAALVGSFMAFSTVTAEAKGVERPAALWFTYACGAIGVRAFGARIPDRVGTHNIVAPALACYAGAMLATAMATETWGFLIAGLLAGLGHGYCFPVLTSQVVTRAPERVRGAALSMFTALWSGAGLAATPVLGFIADQYDDSTMFCAAGLAAVAGLGGWAALEHKLT
jgi:MFS family permease